MDWKITKDHINKPEDGIKSRVGYAYVRNPEKPRPLTVPFKLYDDDNNLYYEGLSSGFENASEEEAFAPLDWAMNDAGCTYMKVRNPRTMKFEML